jgi:hypothetical protein
MDEWSLRRANAKGGVPPARLCKGDANERNSAESSIPAWCRTRYRGEQPEHLGIGLITARRGDERRRWLFLAAALCTVFARQKTAGTTNQRHILTRIFRIGHAQLEKSFPSEAALLALSHACRDCLAGMRLSQRPLKA